MHVSKNTLKSFASVCVIALLVASCGSGANQEGTASQSDSLSLERAGAALMLAMQAPYGTEHSYVPAKELQCAESDFSDHLHLGDPSTHQPFGPPPAGLQVKVANLLAVLDAVDPCEPTGPIERCVIIHFGVDDSDYFDVRLQFLCLTYDSTSKEYTYPESKDCYAILANNTLSFEQDGLVAWRASGGGWFNYANNVVILSGTGASWAKLDDATEPNAGVFSEVALRALIADNKLEEGLLSIVPIATPEKRTPTPGGGYDEQGYHQGAAWVPVGVTLDGVTYPNEAYKNKALDLGMPCPVTCPQMAFTFWTSGTAPRSTCQ